MLLSPDAVHCINPKCKADLGSQMNFCPICGCDQRAPQLRRPVLCPDHVSFANTKFCGNCGAKTVDGGFSNPLVTAAKDTPSPVFAWILAINWLLYWPLAMVMPRVEFVPVACLILDILFISLDHKELRRYGITMPRIAIIAGCLITPIYLIPRALRTRDGLAPAIIAVLAFCQFVGLFAAGWKLSDDLRRSERPLFQAVPPGLSDRQFRGIHEGTSDNEVRDILGAPNDVAKRPGNEENWEYASQTPGIKYVFKFRRGRLYMKLQMYG